MVCDTLKNCIPKAVVHCQVREAKRSLLNHFYVQIVKREVKSATFDIAYDKFYSSTPLLGGFGDDLICLLGVVSMVSCDRTTF